MTMPVGSLVAYLAVDGASKAVGDITGVQRSLDLTGASATAMGAKTDAAMSTATAASSKLQAAQLRATAANERYNALLDSGTASTGRLASAEASLISANLRVAATTDAVNTAMAETVAVAGDSALAGVLRRSGQAAAGLGNGMVSLLKTVSPIQNDFALAGIAIAAVGGLTIHTAEQFQDATKRIQTQAGLTSGQVSVLSHGMLDMAASVGTSATTLADAGYHIASVGLRGSQALDVLRIAAEGAKIGGADLTDVTNGLDAAVVSGIKGVENYSQAMGNLNATVGAGDMSMQDLSDALGTGILAVAKTAGLALTDVDAALATFGDNNIRGSEAATKLRQVIMLMVSPSQQAAGALASIGISSTQLGDDMRKPQGLLVALQDLQANLAASGKTATEQAGIISQAFGGSKTAGSVEILLSQLGRLQSKYEDVDEGAKNFSSDWQAYTKTFSYAASEVKAGAESLGIELGQKLLPAATAALGWIGTQGVKDLGLLGDAAGSILSRLSPLGPALTAADHVVVDLARDLAPIAEIVAGLGFEALAGTATVLGDGLHLVADALNAVDGVVKDTKPEIEGLAAAFLLMKLGGVVSDLGMFSAAMTVAADRAVTLGASLKASAAAGLSALVSPAGLATAAIGGAVAGLIAYQQETSRANAAAKAYLATLDSFDQDKFSSFATLTASVDSQRQHLQQLIGTYGQLSSATQAGWAGLGGATQALDSAQKETGLSAEAASVAAQKAKAALDQLNDTTGRAVTNASTLGSQFSMTADQALQLANANGIDLTKALGDVRPQFDAVAQAAVKDASTAGQLAKDETTLGSALSSAADKASALSDALNLLNGNAIDAEKQQDELTKAISTLTSNLDANSRSLAASATGLGGATVAAGQNREALLSILQPAEAVAVAQAKAGESAADASAQYDANYTALLAAAKAAGLNTTAVQALIAQYHLTPAEVDTKINANVTQANAAVDGVKSNLNTLGPAGAAAGADLDRGLALGIAGNAAAAVERAEQMIDSVNAAVNRKLDRHSPSKVYMQVGRDITAGLALGITAGGIPVMAAMNDILDAIGQAAASASYGTVLSGVEGAVAPKVTDPSQLASSYAWAFDAATQAQDAADKTNASYQSLTAQTTFLTGALIAMGMQDAAAAKAAGPNAAKVTAANTAKEDAQKALITASRNAADAEKTAYQTAASAAQTAAQTAQQAATSLVSSLQSQADAMQQTVTSLESSLTSGIGGQPSLQSIWQNLSQTVNGTTITPNLSAVQANLNSVLAATQGFSTDLTSLVGEGANQDLISQLSAMGATAGDALAQQLLAAGPDAITALQTTMASINSTASDEADLLAQSFYGPGADAMSNFVQGLSDSLPGLTSALAPILTEISGLFGSAVTASATAAATGAILSGPPVPHFAAGVTNFGGGVALVGEYGPEIVDLPRGSSVYPHGTSGPTPVAELHPADRALLREAVAAMQNRPVQLVMGGPGKRVIGEIANEHRQERRFHGDPAYR